MFSNERTAICLCVYTVSQNAREQYKLTVCTTAALSSYVHNVLRVGFIIYITVPAFYVLEAYQYLSIADRQEWTYGSKVRLGMYE